MASHNMQSGALATIILAGILLFLTPGQVIAAERPVLKDGMENFIIHAAPKNAKDIEFENSKGGKLKLSSFHGKLVLLNFWATWCAPCRREMTDLDLLQNSLGGDKFHVLALSSDRQGLTIVAPFYEQMKLKYLQIYTAGGLQTARSFRVLGLPVTILISPNGKEIGRMVGPADWNSPAAKNLIKFYLPK